MELNWSTFLLEIVNFLVLVWILKHFLYKPVLDIIARRRADIDKTLSEAKAVETNAKELRERYDSRLAAWEAEKRQAREALTLEIEKERASRLAELSAALEQERQKAQVAETHRLAVLRDQRERAALELGARFATRVLESAASPELQGRLVDLLLEELEALPADRVREIVGNSATPPDAISVTSAFELPEDRRAKLTKAFVKATRLDVPVRFDEDPGLLAGLRVTIGASVLGLNLTDELRDFASFANGRR